MQFTADLHIHSRFSRATSPRLTASHLRAWAMVKGVRVLGTGDITHPAWRAELREHLIRDEHTGLYHCAHYAPLAHEIPLMDTVRGLEPLFLLQGEISSIYKRHGAVRRVHNVVFFPDLDAADRFCARLEGIGNLASDGRPILGLDCADLLELLKDTVPEAELVPAHVWTPWFALFGSKSGFDSVEACFGHMSPEIFAMETGLSSDPAMNRLWSHLDGYTLISNSDAHSGENLAREVNVFAGTPSYAGIFQALRRSPTADCAYAGTVEFFPEEGKYHLDGHRACNVVLEPHEAMALNNICPVCGKPLTIGVLHRVLELADRAQPAVLAGEAAFTSLVPLPELLGEILRVGAKSRKVAQHYAQLIGHFGSELDILNRIAESDLRQRWEALGEGIARMRRGEVIREGGYDGEYGTVRVFTPQEVTSFQAGRSRGSLLALESLGGKGKAARPDHGQKNARATQKVKAVPLPTQAPAPHTDISVIFPNTAYSPEQQAIIGADAQPLLVVAGPGAGKTRTLIGRIAHLLAQGIPARRILAVTFTRRAATELEDRLRAQIQEAVVPLADTLHALALSVWHKKYKYVPHILSEDMSHRVFALAQQGVPECTPRCARQWEEQLSVARETCVLPPELEACAERYREYKHAHNWVDYTDLLEFWLRDLHEGAASVPAAPRTPWSHVLVDEVQDLSPLQLALVRALLPAEGTGFFGIGDPDQAIYGFRGAQPHIVRSLRNFWPALRCVPLGTSYRAAPAIVACASNLMQGRQECGPLRAHSQRPASLHLFTAPRADSEAQWVAGQIHYLLGDTSHTLADVHAVSTVAPHTHLERASCAPADIAVLVRLKVQIPPLKKALTQWGIPCAVPEQEGYWHHPLVALVLAQAAQQVQGAPPDVPVPARGEDETLIMPPCPKHVWRGGPPALAVYLQHCAPFDALFWEDPAWKAVLKAWTTAAGWKGLLAHIHLMRDVEMARNAAERVQILTLHAAKGLEFKAVFIPGLEEGLLPLDRQALYAASDTGGKFVQSRDEERRLLYVGLTRASDAVFCSYAAQRTVYGRTLHLAPSSFLRDIRQHYQMSALRETTHRQQEQLSLLR
ncbi:MAG: UvrD-helicase domain-containing protein [Desulfovibrionaceae bacterium]